MIRIVRLDEMPREEILKRELPAVKAEKAVSEIISDVRENGDEALFRYTERFDGVFLSSLEVSEEEIQNAVNKVGTSFMSLLSRAAANIREFHEKQLRTGFFFTREDGSVLGQRVIPMDRVGVYVPGGTAPLSSTVLMDVIPAKIAGCPEVIVCTPPGKDGNIAPAVLAAASVAGADRVFMIGGAQAVAAMAYGTETVPRTDKIVGPGNVYVAEAKRQVYGAVSIDMIAGPSEILVVSDGESDPRILAADLLSQAEHDVNASAVLITDCESLAEETAMEIERQLPLLSRQEIARASIEQNGRIIITENIEEALDISNDLAPEHLELAVNDPFTLLGKIKHAGSVFLGRNTPEALGDYLAGPNHTLPTGGTARFSSPLSVDDFVKKIQVTSFTAEALDAVRRDIADFAMAEGLTGHAKSALIRGELSRREDET
ncbi:MAG: histidinol dehydrogenase [Oscillospiraceae bacterium]|nr:histidinol dehydrogenase [Oscillospiraceae bacterium]